MLLIFIMLPLLILCCLSNRQHKIWILITVTLLFLFFIFVIGLRDSNYGLDIVTYYGIFNDPSYYILDEKALYFLNYVLKIISDEYVFFAISYYVILNSLLLLLYRSISKEFFLLYFALTLSSFIFFQINFNIYRQGLAVILVLLAMYCAYKGHIFLPILIVIVAFCFHKASIIGFFLIIISFFNIKFKPGYAYVSLFSSIVTFHDSVFIYITKVLVELFPLYANSITEYVRLTGSDIIQSSGFNHRNLPLMVSLLFYAIYYNPVILNSDGLMNRFSDKVAIVSCFILLISSLFTSNVLLYDRIIIFCQLLSPVLTVSVFGVFLKRESKIRLAILFVCILQLVFTLLIWGPRNFIPEYEFISL